MIIFDLLEVLERPIFFFLPSGEYLQNN